MSDSMEIKVLGDADKAKWDEFVLAEGGTFFHRAGWRDVITKAMNHPCYYLFAEVEGRITGILPLAHVKSALFGNALVSTGFCVGGGPFARSDEAFRALNEAAQELAVELGVDHIEYRGVAMDGENWHQKSDLYANFSRDMDESEDDCLKQIPRKQRAVVRKALKNEELEVTIDEEVDDFFKLYATSVRNLGTPVFSRKLFQTLMDEFGNDCEILTIRHNGKAVSSVMSFYHGPAVMPYYTGSLADARRLGSNDLMYWKVMRRAIEKGFRVFDFGRSKTGTGPYSFKKNWGFTPEPTTHSFYLPKGDDIPEVNPNNPKYALMIKTWKKLPLPVANFLGPMIVRNIA